MTPLKALMTVVLSIAPVTAFAEPTMTVESLLKQEFAVVGTITSTAGPGIFLQKKDQLVLCFVAETPQSSAVTTRYCKPVQ
jgi:hypothetical protein